MTLITSILTGGSNNHETTSEEVNALSTDIMKELVVGSLTNTSGVAPMTGGFATNQQGTPAMAVDVSSGVVYVEATPTGQSSQLLRVKSSATEAVTINSNSSGSTRYDWIYVKIDPDTAADPASDASDVATLVVSRSTSNTADDGTPPTYGTLIAVVTVANGQTAITNSMIADKRAALCVESVLASSFSSTTTSSFQDTGLDITLPFAGTWLIQGDLRVACDSSEFAVFRLYDETVASAITNSERLGILSSAAGQQATTSLNKKVTATVANTVVRLEMKPGGSYAVGVNSDSNGRTALVAHRILVA